MPKLKSLTLILALIWSLAATTAAFSKENIINVRVGKKVVITLDSNITTGYRWQFVKPVDSKFLMILGLRYIKPDSKLVGSGGKEEWIFKALKPGKANISIQYVRPWENSSKPAKVENFVVIIK